MMFIIFNSIIQLFSNCFIVVKGIFNTMKKNFTAIKI